jgi:predicted metal-dependent peptidase
MFQDNRQTNPFMDTRNNTSALLWENMPLEKRLRKVISDIASSSIFASFGPATMMGEKEIGKIATACTDGYNMAFGDDFCLKQSEKGLRFIVCHEVLHILKRDVYVLMSLFKKNPDIANRAADYTNNADLVAMDPKKTFLDWDLVDIQICLNTERWPSGTSPFVVFRDLMEDQDKGEPDTGDQPLDEHDFDGAAGQSPEEQQKRQKEIDRSDEQGKVAEKRMKESDGETSIGDGEGGRIRKSRFADTIVPWGDVLTIELSQIAQGHDSTTFGRVNRRHASNRRTVLPANISERIGRILVACDTSASVDEKKHALHMGGTAQIFQSLRPSGVDVLYWGTSIERHEEYDEFDIEDFAHSTKPTGKGGTKLQCVKEWIDQCDTDFEAIIVFTDGDLFGQDWKLTDWGAPVYYCVTDPKNWKIEPEEGTLISVMD